MLAPMGITVRDRGSRGWWVRVSTATGRREWKAGPPGQEGEQIALQVAAELAARGERATVWDDGPRGRVRLDELLRGWRERHAPLRSERTQITDYARVERLAAHFGGLDPERLTEDAVRAYVAAELAAGRSGWTAAGCVAVLRRVVTLAARSEIVKVPRSIDWGAIVREARRATLREIPTRDAWTRAEAAAMVDLARRKERHVYPVLVAALHTGARRGELLALRWEDVDLRGRTLTIRRAATPSAGTKVPKSGRSRRVPISQALLSVLHSQRARSREWVFPSPTGLFWAERNFSRAWERLREHFAAAQVRSLPWHSTRHTHISWALDAGQPVRRVCEWVGASLETIERHYAHAIPQADPMAWLDAAGTGLGPGGTRKPKKR